MPKSLKTRNRLTQLQAIALLASAAHENGALIISDIGSQSLWLHASGDHPSHLYLSGPMGMASSVAFGVAVSFPNRPVLAICGDGGLAMNLGSLATISSENPPNLTLAVMDNGTYEFTGNLPSPSAGIRWASAGEAFHGFADVTELDPNTQISFSANKGLRVIVCYIKQDQGRPPPLLLDGPMIHRRFKSYCTQLEL
jgi:thiamine pyrophosphate-dependent acetolactate synthase large subunit-like protein